MSERVSQDWVEAKLEELEPWREGAWERAKGRATRGETTAQEALEQVAKEELSSEQWDAVWTLYDSVEGVMQQAAADQVSRMPVEWADVSERLGAHLPLVFLRVLALYDPQRGHSNSDDFADDDRVRLTTFAYNTTRRRVWRLAQPEEGEQKQRIELALSRLRRQVEPRDPSMREKVDTVLDVADLRSRETARSWVNEIERDPDARLDAPVPGESDDSDRLLKDVIAGDSSGSIDTRKVGHAVAEKTNRIELWEALMGEKPATRSFSRAEARTILLELRARQADAEALAFEHETSPYVISLIADQKGPYNVEVSEAEVSQYKATQRYETDIEEVRRRRREGETLSEITKHVPFCRDTVSAVCRGEGAYSNLAPIESTRRALSNEEVREVRRRRRQGEPYSDLASAFSCSKNTIWAALKGRGAYDHFDTYS